MVLGSAQKSDSTKTTTHIGNCLKPPEKNYMNLIPLITVLLITLAIAICVSFADEFDEQIYVEDVHVNFREKALMLLLVISTIIHSVMYVPDEICVPPQNDWAWRGFIAFVFTFFIVVLIWFEYYQIKREALNHAIFSVLRWIIVVILIGFICSSWCLTGIRITKLNVNGVCLVAQAFTLAIVIFIVSTYLLVKASTWLDDYRNKMALQRNQLARTI